MNYKVSVIIPCYNAENTIERSITSVINQTLGFENIELLLYDDASTDSTPKILGYYSKKYENIVTIFSKENSGRPCKGRNVCMDNASSDFIMFMDNDDEYHKDICKTLYEEIISSNSDIVTCGFINSDNISVEKMIPAYLPDKGVVENNKIIFSNKNVFYFNNYYIWNCIFKKDIIHCNKIYFPEKDLAEDIYFMNNYKLYIDKLVYLKDYFGLVKYIQNDSITISTTIKELNNLFDVQVGVYNNLIKFDVPVDFIFNKFVQGFLYLFHISNSLTDSKNDIIDFFIKLRNFEIKSDINHSIGVLFKIPNFFIMHELYHLAIWYFKFLKVISNQKVLIKFYRKISK